MNQQRNKNIDLVNELESELNKNKQLEKELEKNIKNVQDQTLENECQEIYNEIKNLQEKYEKEIDKNREIQKNDIDNNIISYYDNGFSNTLENE